MPNEGIYSCKQATVEQCEEVMSKHSDITSAIGHQGSADALNAIFYNLDCAVNRIVAKMNQGDCAICIKIKGRLNEGDILTIEKMNEIGFDLFIVNRLQDNVFGECFDAGFCCINRPEDPNYSMKSELGLI